MFVLKRRHICYCTKKRSSQSYLPRVSCYSSGWGKINFLSSGGSIIGCCVKNSAPFSLHELLFCQGKSLCRRRRKERTIKYEFPYDGFFPKQVRKFIKDPEIRKLYLYFLWYQKVMFMVAVYLARDSLGGGREIYFKVY